MFNWQLLKVKKVFLALGNDRPQILVQLEDCVLHAIIAISEGKPSEAAIDALHSQVQSLVKDLDDDAKVLNWFNQSKAAFTAPSISQPSTSQPSEFPSTPLAGVYLIFFFNSLFNKDAAVRNLINDKFQG